MSNRGKTVAQRNKAIRQEDLRERIRNSNLLTDILDNVAKMQSLAEDMDGDSANLHIQQINGYQMSNNQRLKLLNKVLPDLKAIEVEGDIGLQVVEVSRIGMEEPRDDE